MARKTVLVSDFSHRAIADTRWSAVVTIRYGDRRRGTVVADAHIEDEIVRQISASGHQQAGRGARAARRRRAAPSNPADPAAGVGS
jgi:hypothetical protein